MRISSESLSYAALAYADIFEYPLTLREWRLFSLFISRPPVKKLAGVEKRIVNATTYYFLRGREKIINTRLSRTHFALSKWKKAAIVARALGRIPTVHLVGVTGGLAMNNAKQDDDIDLYCVTEKNTLWMTRFLVTIFVSLLGVRRTPKAKDVTDMFCLNMFTTVDGMSIPVGERDLFSAHEVVQMVPLWERKGTYRKFILHNRWVKNYLPTAWRKCQAQNVACGEKINVRILTLLEPVARILQLWYMKKRHTSEVLGDKILRFHPKDARVWIKKKLQKRLAKYDISLDSVFIHQLE